MKRNKYIKQCGPYKVYSISQDGRGPRLEVYPAFPQYNLSEKERQAKYVAPEWLKEPRWAIHRLKLGNGGGPSIFSVMGLAEEFEEFLNQKYSPEEVEAWKKTLAEATAEIRAKDQKSFERAMARQTKGRK